MVRYVAGDLLNSQAGALVNTVNCKGTMGKGIAKEFAKRFPEIVEPYRIACQHQALRPGVLQFIRLTVQPDLFGFHRPAVINFPTKVHWRGRSRLEWIEDGLQDLKSHYADWGVESIAMPQLGCGLGGLEWSDVKPLIEKYFEGEPIDVEVYVRIPEEVDAQVAANS